MLISGSFPWGLIVNLCSRFSLLTLLLREISSDVTKLFATEALHFRIIPFLSIPGRTQSIISSVITFSSVEVSPVKLLLSFLMTGTSCKCLILIIGIPMLGYKPSLLLRIVSA